MRTNRALTREGFVTMSIHHLPAEPERTGQVLLHEQRADSHAMTADVTARLLLKLANQGEIQADDPPGPYVPGLGPLNVRFDDELLFVINDQQREAMINVIKGISGFVVADLTNHILAHCRVVV